MVKTTFLRKFGKYIKGIEDINHDSIYYPYGLLQVAGCNLPYHFALLFIAHNIFTTEKLSTRAHLHYYCPCHEQVATTFISLPWLQHKLFLLPMKALDRAHSTGGRELSRWWVLRLCTGFRGEREVLIT